MARTELLYAQYTIFIMISGIETRQIVFSRLKYDEYLIGAVEFAHIYASLVVVETQHVGSNHTCRPPRVEAPFSFRVKRCTSFFVTILPWLCLPFMAS